MASSEPITQLAIKEVMDNQTYLVSVATEYAVSVFITKVPAIAGKASATQKSKVVKKECQIKTSEQIIHSEILNEKTLAITYGSVFAMKRQQTSLLDDAGKVIKEITLSSALTESGKPSAVKSKKEENYQVMGIEDEGMARANNAAAGR